MRRLARDVPYAGSAVWTRRLAVWGSVLALASVVLPRRGIDVWHAVGLLVAGLFLAALALPFAAASAVVIWRTGYKGAGRALAGLVLGLVTLAYPAYLSVRTLRDTPAADLSTDPQNPPQFVQSATLAAPGGPRPGWLDLAWVIGRTALPTELEPVITDQDPLQAYRSALKIATQLHWRVVAATAPTARAPTGRIDAVTYSGVMRLPEDVAIRIASRDGQTRIDIRSASRLAGLPLAGDDPLRNIQAFADALEDQDAEN